MLTKDDLEQIAGLIKTSEERLGKRIEAVDNKVGAAETSLTKKIETIDLKVEAVHEFNKKAHKETMETLLDIGEINYKELQKELKALKKRVEQLEGRQQN